MFAEEKILHNNENNFIDSLNPEQKQAVLHMDGPLLVLAGAGTGKTKVLVCRIANLLAQKKAFPGQILAVTFTNKAAREMKERIRQLTDLPVENMWIGTFHSIASRILRRHAELINLTNDFTIIDTDDQLKLAKQVLEEFNINRDHISPKALVYWVQKFKDRALTPDKITQADCSEAPFIMRNHLSKLYAAYQAKMLALNAVDFGDLLLHVITLFNKSPEICHEYNHKFKYILVDEYQDTNVAQYLWLRLLTQKHSNICCVGDDDQSIYGWRGAEIANILRFDKDYPQAALVRLERNYRSTAHILASASNVIANNGARHRKTLWTEQKCGDLVKLNNFYDDRDEARFIAEEIEMLVRNHKIPLREMAILVRAGYQTRSFEEAFNFYQIPYRVVGSRKFYDRAEIRDVIAYIRVLNNQNDDLAFTRIINVPKRGVGNTTIANLNLSARDKGISMLQAARDWVNSGKSKARAASNLQLLLESFEQNAKRLAQMPHWEVVNLLLNETGYIDMWRNEGTNEGRERLDNIKELINALQEFTDLNEYIEHISLVTDMDKEDNENVVNIMTMHAAKGLEFNVVFLPGWEEGVFPTAQAVELNNDKAIEEERRLAYVGITRARQKLYISHVSHRRIYGSMQFSVPSRFLAELPKEACETMFG
jgi:DNA helicase-2/ATP-dependent DNA helicase PcrA